MTVLLGYTLMAITNGAPTLILSLALIFGGVLTGMIGR
jgi:hypothetical protein